MTQVEEKAREIVIKMQFQKEPLTFEQAKNCSLVLIQEIKKDRERLNDALFYNEDYWDKVENELYKL